MENIEDMSDEDLMNEHVRLLDKIEDIRAKAEQNIKTHQKKADEIHNELRRRDKALQEKRG